MPEFNGEDSTVLEEVGTAGQVARPMCGGEESPLCQGAVASPLFVSPGWATHPGTGVQLTQLQC